jgi:hypothetical protein
LAGGVKHFSHQKTVTGPVLTLQEMVGLVFCLQSQYNQNAGVRAKFLGPKRKERRKNEKTTKS